MPAKDYFNSNKRALSDTPPGLLRRSFSLILVILMSLAILVSISGYFFLRYEKDKMTRQVENELKAIVDQGGAFVGKDYRGVDVISILAPIPDTPWYMSPKSIAPKLLRQ
jgi:hypothetical protein